MSLNIDLLEATALNNYEKVVSLLKEGADPNYVGEQGYAPLHGASISGYNNIAEALITHGADINMHSGDGGFTALHFASLEGHLKIVELLVNAKADVNAKDDWGNGPLFRAGKNELIGTLLMDNGADPYMENNYGVSPKNSGAVAFEYLADPKMEETESSTKSLMEVVESGSVEDLKLALSNVSDLEEKNGKGKSAFYVAVEKENVQFIELLAEAGADINTTENFGYTPLAIASMRGKLELVKLLIEKGAKTDIPLPFDNTLKTLAKKHTHVLKYLDSL